MQRVSQAGPSQLSRRIYDLKPADLQQEYVGKGVARLQRSPSRSPHARLDPDCAPRSRFPLAMSRAKAPEHVACSQAAGYFSGV
jgi:hypothetical protein